MTVITTCGCRLGWGHLYRQARAAALSALSSLGVGLLPPRVLSPLQRHALDPRPPFDGDPSNGAVHRLTSLPGRRLWLVTGHAETRAVLTDQSRFSNDFANLSRTGLPLDHPGGLGFADPPDHTRLRRLLAPEFTRARLAAVEPRIAEIVTEQLQLLAERGSPADLWRDFALPVPTRTICEFLGLPEEHQADYQRLSTARFDLRRGAGASLGAVSSALHTLTDTVRTQRARPGDGLVGRIIRTHGDQVSDRELAGLVDGILTGGLESTASMLALGALVLMQDPPLAQRLRDSTPQDAARCVEELLRYLSVVQVSFPRFARHDTQVGQHPIRRGDVVVCSLVAANRSPDIAPSPSRIDPDHPSDHHLAFGFGAHRCLGAELARLELRTAYTALTRRFPSMRLAVPATDLRFRPTSIVYGLNSLPVHLTPTTPTSQT